MEEKTIWLKQEHNYDYRSFIHVWKDGSISIGIKDKKTGEANFMPLSNILTEMADNLWRLTVVFKK